jgi:hypothetical protein
MPINETYKFSYTAIFNVTLCGDGDFAVAVPACFTVKSTPASKSLLMGRTQETEFYARQALIALENDACQ